MGRVKRSANVISVTVTMVLVVTGLCWARDSTDAKDEMATKSEKAKKLKSDAKEAKKDAHKASESSPSRIMRPTPYDPPAVTSSGSGGEGSGEGGSGVRRTLTY